MSRRQAGFVSGGVRAGFEAGVFEALMGKEHRQEEPDKNNANAEVKRLRSQTIDRGYVSGEPRRKPYCEIAGKFVQAEGQSSTLGAHEVDFHVYRHRPTEGLIDAEQNVGNVEPNPAIREDDHEGHGQSHNPPTHENTLAPPSFGNSTCEKIADRFRDPKGGDEGYDGGLGGQTEIPFADQRNHGAFQTHHHAYKEIDDHKKRKLA